MERGVQSPLLREATGRVVRDRGPGPDLGSAISSRATSGRLLTSLSLVLPAFKLSSHLMGPQEREEGTIRCSPRRTELRRCREWMRNTEYFKNPLKNLQTSFLLSTSCGERKQRRRKATAGSPPRPWLASKSGLMGTQWAPTTALPLHTPRPRSDIQSKPNSNNSAQK